MAGFAGAGTSIILRLDMYKELVTFAQIAAAIGDAGGDIVAIDVNRITKTKTTRDITVNVTDQLQTDAIIKALSKLNGVKVVNVSDQTFLLHLGGKIETTPKIPIKNRDDLSRVYTPGVAQVCMAIHNDPTKAHSLTIKRNTVAVISDGTAVLGLGNIGAEAAMPVMEGKAMLFKQMAGVDAFPICLNTQDTEEIISICKAIAPAFGGINLEDISSPRCFEIECRLIEELDIPVFHDDQHGTAVVLLAGLLNACRVTGKKLEDCKVVVCGIGAAGIACTKILLAAGVKNVIGIDRQGALVRGEEYPYEAWSWYAEHTNPHEEKGPLSRVIENADIFIGLSGPGVLKVEDVKKMAKDPIVFAMANPTPEISPDDAEPYVRVMATGRSDYPNQINNVLCFPGIFRGVLDCRASRINEQMKLAAARAIASVVSDDELNEFYIIPSVFNRNVVKKVKEAVIAAAYETGVARRRGVNQQEEEMVQ
ncbi:NAD-dependent malic enzyme [Paenibacillus larvae subsp. larvae]|uniref:NAD-dependent malic enzyme n=3 Tax=Paenibacillus larvae TaxID=1464 RepID=V9W6N3_9BACL|nr:NAD-dependent malic enzyme [Paenibacillus larvae]AHD06706.1 NAD-dependent malic enzyme [Paenibacillus larvae subsp. larvae DSM 25430]AQZ46172.1 NAD-dependent malic enzyme [Paenibacillus larvae subsp. pulvifaciens]ARF67510.1 NAD-dependent malic enzyme [Paenibacillus larvae subsp. pulvifaciens]AVF27838.1 NAD-dependent malic enzyme [Paenibacillus larvae subsp. larvae]AVF32341.1 NAD-dependent malic enzyme [Paenibacillus larvae subsp. larvae]